MPASFRSTTNPPYPRSWGPNDKILTDPLTGAPVGVQNQNANGFDGQWSPVLVTAAQIANQQYQIQNDCWLQALILTATTVVANTVSVFRIPVLTSN